MNAVLDFPPLPTDAAPRTEVATAAAAALDLKKINLTDVALAQFGDWRAALADAKERLKDVAWDVSTAKGLKDIKSVRQREAKDPRAEANKIADALASKLTAVGQEVRAEQKLIVAAWDKLAEPLTAIIDAREAELAEEARKEAEAAAERARIEREAAEAHAARLAAIATFVERSREPGMTAERISNGMLILTETDVDDEDKARAVELADAQCRALETMRTLRDQAAAREAEAARQEAQRQENERVAAELAAERARIAEEAAEIRRQAAALEAARAAEIVRENQRKAEEEAARAESERLEALAVANRERLAAQQAEDARVAALAEQRRQDAAAESARLATTVFVARGLVLDPPAASLREAMERTDPIRPDDPDAAPAATLEEMGAEKPEQLDDAALTPPLREAIFPCAWFGGHIELNEPLRPDPQSAALADLQALATEARASRFPSQPKMGTEWWSRFYAAADVLTGAA